MSKKKVIKWLLNGDTGVSSKTIAACYLGVEYKSGCHPWDPADFLRCVALIEKIPDVKNCFDKLANKNEKWANLVERWDEIEKTLKREMSERTGRAPITYKMIKECIND